MSSPHTMFDFGMSKATGGGTNPNPSGSTFAANGYNNAPLNISPTFPQLPTDATNQLTKIYGNGFGNWISSFINGGAGYNPQVLQTLINQIQPEVQRGIGTLNATAGAGGTAYSSGHDLGLADYLSQVNQNELGMASGLYEQSLNNVLNLTQNSILGPVSQKINNQGGFLTSLLSSIIGGGSGGILGNVLGNIFPSVFGSQSGGGGGGGLNIPGINLPGGSTTPLPGTNDSWGNVNLGGNSPLGNNPPASGNTGIPGGALSDQSGNALLNFIFSNFNMQPGAQFPNISPGQISGISGGQSQVPIDYAGVGASGDIPFLQELPL